MMENLLEMLRQGQIYALPELAEKLQISEELLLAKLERYEQLGVVRRVCMDTSECKGSCKRCRGCGGMKTEGASTAISWWIAVRPQAGRWVHSKGTQVFV